MSGYGGFGARLSRRLAKDGWRVLVAGRNVDAATRVAAQLFEAEPLFADGNGALLKQHRPVLLIDAAGPFQASDYRALDPQAAVPLAASFGR